MITNLLDPTLYLDIFCGKYTDKYFLRTQEIMNHFNLHTKVLMQVFAKKKGILCGIKELKNIFSSCLKKVNLNELNINSLNDGDKFNEWETVMTIEGDYSAFAHLETVYLGLLARMSNIATNMHNCVKAVDNKIPIMFYGARFDSLLTQEIDGYAATIGGACDVSTNANGYLIDKEGVGTIPHSLIALYNGDIVKAALAFDEVIDSNVKRIVLVDFNNSCVGDSIAVAKALGNKLWGVRLDTSEKLIDKSVYQWIKTKALSEQILEDEEYVKRYLGVCPKLVQLVRKGLDDNGFKNVKIVVSGGFNPIKLQYFTDMNIPIDLVGIGSYIYKGNIDFTADIVMVNGEPCSKVGRGYNPNKRLVKW
jgi:nicotinate phosphoribosyltransferase